MSCNSLCLARLAALLACAWVSTSLAGATFTVSNLNDSGAGSLRQAIIDAQGTPAFDAIVFQSGLSGTITLASALPVITTPLNIVNTDALALTVSGANSFRVISCSDGADLYVNGLTIADGASVSTGGGVYAASTSAAVDLTMSRCIIRDCAATDGAGGYLTAGVSFLLSASFDSCTFTGNAATGNGGGLASAGLMLSLAMVNCTFSGNTAGGAGGGIRAAHGFTALLTNCTITLNQAATAGGYSRTNGGIDLLGCILAGNLGPASSPDGSGTLGASGEGNLFGIITGMTGATDPTDQFGTGAAPLDPMLLPLADNGGGVLTHALLNASSAVDAGDTSSAPASDGRGYNRVDVVDCGAFELQPPQIVVSYAGNPVSSGTLLFLSGTTRPNAARAETFTITNYGQAGEKNLVLDALFPVYINPPQNCTVTITKPPATTLTPGASDTFIISITPITEGLFALDLRVQSNDPTNPTHVVNLVGVADAAAGSGGGDNEGSCSTHESVSPLAALAALLSGFFAVRRARRVRMSAHRQ